MKTISHGTLVRLNTPDNPRLHGKTAQVWVSTDYGAIVKTDASATGEYRASFEEMELLPAESTITTNRARQQGYSGDVCTNCQGCRVKRNGSCLVCEDCGQTTGCS